MRSTGLKTGLRRSSRCKNAHRRRTLRAELLEDRRLLAVTLVNTSFDGGVPSNLDRLGTATYQGGSWIELTPAANGKTGTLRVDGHGQAASDFTVRFNQSIKNSTSSAPGDGIAFGYGALPSGAWGNSGPGQFDGQAGPRVNGLFVKFDTFPNSGTIDVYYNKVLVKLAGRI